MKAKRFQLTEQMVASHGGQVVCLADSAIGRVFRLKAERPSASSNRGIYAGTSAARTRAKDEAPLLVEISVDGPLEERAGYHEVCGGWSDGHDAIAERTIEALQTSDVLVRWRSPGGVLAGMQEAIKRVLEAKSEYGRRITSYVDEEMCSAALWWAASISDEIWGPLAMNIGSIGARSAHVSVARKLAREGVEVTHFAMPDGKVAFAGDKPLTKLGSKRGMRDVRIAFEHFAHAMIESRGLSMKEIIDLDADVLQGQEAVDAKLADGIASLSEVIDRALAQASRSKDEMQTNKTSRRAASSVNREHVSRVALTTSAGEAPKTPEDNETETSEDDDDAPPAPPAEGTESPMEADACDSCGTENPDGAKYCNECGKPMKPGEPTAENDDDDDPTAEDDDDDPTAEDDDDDDPTAEDEDPAKSKAQRRDSARNVSSVKLEGRSLASILGLHDSASQVALKKRAASLLSLSTYAQKITGTNSPSAAEGGLRSLADEAHSAAGLRERLTAARKRLAFNERMQLCARLVALNLSGYSRGEVFTDRVIGSGDKEKIVSVPSAMFSEMRLSTLRGFVDNKAKIAKKTGPTSPFANPDRTASRRSATHAIGAELVGGEERLSNLAQFTHVSSEKLAATAAELAQQAFPNG